MFLRALWHLSKRHFDIFLSTLFTPSTEALVMRNIKERGGTRVSFLYHRRSVSLGFLFSSSWRGCQTRGLKWVKVADDGSWRPGDTSSYFGWVRSLGAWVNIAF